MTQTVEMKSNWEDRTLVVQRATSEETASVGEHRLSGCPDCYLLDERELNESMANVLIPRIQGPRTWQRMSDSHSGYTPTPKSFPLGRGKAAFLPESD